MTFKIYHPTPARYPSAAPRQIAISCNPEFKELVIESARKQKITTSAFCRQAIQYAIDHMEDET